CAMLRQALLHARPPSARLKVQASFQRLSFPGAERSNSLFWVLPAIAIRDQPQLIHSSSTVSLRRSVRRPASICAARLISSPNGSNCFVASFVAPRQASLFSAHTEPATENLSPPQQDFRSWREPLPTPTSQHN